MAKTGCFLAVSLCLLLAGPAGRSASGAAESFCLSQRRPICEYDLMTAACGDLILTLRMGAAGSLPASLSFLIERIKKEGGIISRLDKQAGKITVCYGGNSKSLRRRKRRLAKHPAVLHVSYRFLSGF